jgi:hypothetical protein
MKLFIPAQLAVFCDVRILSTQVAIHNTMLTLVPSKWKDKDVIENGHLFQQPGTNYINLIHISLVRPVTKPDLNI